MALGGIGRIKNNLKSQRGQHLLLPLSPILIRKFHNNYKDVYIKKAARAKANLRG